MKTNKRLIFFLLSSIVLYLTITFLIYNVAKNKESSQAPDINLTAMAQTEQFLLEQTRLAGTGQAQSSTPTLVSSPSFTSTDVRTLTATPTYTTTATMTHTATPTTTTTVAPSITSTSTSTSTSTPNPGMIWSGQWTGYFGMEIGSVYETDIVITVVGNQVSGVATFKGSPTTFDGSFSDDFRLVTGSWSARPAWGNFTWYLVGDNQFVGNRDNAFAYCGSRNGAPMPEPCFGP
jgi:hypothetical protein